MNNTKNIEGEKESLAANLPVEDVYFDEKGKEIVEFSSDLEAAGYEVLPFLLPACGVNAPHRRDRIWFVAFNSKCKSNGGYNTGKSGGTGLGMGWDELDQTGWIEGADNTQSSGSDGLASDSASDRRERAWQGIEVENREPRSLQNGFVAGGFEGLCRDRITPNPTGVGLWNQDDGQRKSRFPDQKGKIDNWQNFPTQPPVRGGDDGFPTGLLRQRIREDSLGCLSEKEIDKIFSEAANKWSKESIKAMGNAVVPQVVLQIFKGIEQYDKHTNHERLHGKKY